jgi:AraC-like DNA-binding protein
MLVAQQLEQCLGILPVVHHAADVSVLAVIPLESRHENYQKLCAQLENLQQQLNVEHNLTLSACFTNLEQISTAYWQVRNAAAQAKTGSSLHCLSDQLWEYTSAPEISLLERLNEALLAGQVDSAQALVIQMFGSDDLTPEEFLQIFYSIRGVILNTAEKIRCEDIRFLCVYDRHAPMKKLIQNLCECCFAIGNHVESMKQSHNVQLQQKILRWLDENFSNPDLNVAMAADHFDISKKYVSQFLKDQTGKSYNEYLEDLRLNHAMTLLNSSDLSITDIAVRCGFSSQNTFYKAFRRRYELSPSAVRRNKIQESSM